MRKNIEILMKKINLNAEEKEVFLNAYDTVVANKNKEFNAILNDFDFTNYDEYLTALKEMALLGESVGIHKYTAEMLYLLCKAESVRELYCQKGIDEEIFWDSMKDLQYKIEECKLIYGVVGTFVSSWFYGFYNLTRFQLCRLQFEVCETPKDFEIDGKVLPKGSKYINVHIPRTGTKLDHNLVKKSYDLAAEMFKHEFIGKPIYFACHSWMLYPWNMEVLEKDSNMAKFYNDFRIVESGDNEGYDEVWRLFDCLYTENLDDLPENTSLRKAYKNRIKSGGAWGFGMGFFEYK